MNIVLHQPEIPQNTGNIGRTCAATNTALHLIRPLGFNVDDKSLKRAGMDYWHELELYYYDSFKDFLEKNPEARIIMATTKARKNYCDIEYKENDFIMFGSEGSGIPEEILMAHKENCVRIPMLSGCRSLNLSNSAAIVLYE
ncbi:MAG: tRNA (cytidine(34)-2'-O)-methyltransferase, partial [Firmicutes bacterium]|nr:tRNA (cytidine(34)-2'-O)-methyltransferase [Bacillota bacterium]